jgi:hypothetical protein
MTDYNRSRIWGKTGVGGLLVLTGMLFFPSKAVYADEDGGFNQVGNIVIADQFDNRVIEIDPEITKSSGPSKMDRTNQDRTRLWGQTTPSALAS